MTLDMNDTATILGIVFGLSGFILGIVNHLRDKAKVTVGINWDMSMANNSVYDPNKSWALISVANVGRRPIYLSHASLRIPKGYGTSHRLVAESVAGKKLSEGDPPLTFPLDQTGLEKYAKDWKKIRAEIIDSTGKKWSSKRLCEKNKPSWVDTSEDES